MNAIYYATEIVKKLKNAGYVSYFAGGWVRDHLMRHESADVDIATEAPPEKILDLFPSTILVGLAFGVVIVNMEGHQFEVATFRKDFGYSDGRKPDKIEFCGAREDALRRDFTINGMFYDPLERVIHDYVQGAEDLHKGIIRAIGNPYERFTEDRLRMIRAIRFASKFCFSIDPETEEAIVANADGLFPAVAKERVWMEFKKMAGAQGFDHALAEMHRFGLLPVIFPILEGVHLNEIRQRIAYFKNCKNRLPAALYLSELFPDASLETLVDIFQSLRVSRQELSLVEAKVRGDPFFSAKDSFDACDFAHFYAHPHTDLLIDLKGAKYEGQKKEVFFAAHEDRKLLLYAHIERIKSKKPLITAAFLMNYGIKPGTNMGALLKEAEKIAINKNLNDPQEVLKLLQTTQLWKTHGDTKTNF